MKHLSLFAVATCLAGAAHADAMGDFANIFAQCEATHKAIRAGEVVADAPPLWVRKITTESKLKYEISQKYYSSPFVAVLTVDRIEGFGAANSQAAAQQLVAGPDNRLQRDVVRMGYIAEGGRWRTTEVTVGTETKAKRDDPWGPASIVKMDRDAALKANQPWAACLR